MTGNSKSYQTFDHCGRMFWYLYQTSRIMRSTGQTTLADAMLAKSVTWASATIQYYYGGYSMSAVNPRTNKQCNLNNSHAYTTAETANNPHGRLFIYLDGSQASNQEMFGMSAIAMMCADSMVDDGVFSLSARPKQQDGSYWSGSDHTFDAILKRSVDHAWWAQQGTGHMPHDDYDQEVSDGYHTATTMDLVMILNSFESASFSSRATPWYSRLYSVIDEAVRWWVDMGIVGDFSFNGAGGYQDKMPTLQRLGLVTDDQARLRYSMANIDTEGYFGIYGSTQGDSYGALPNAMQVYAPQLFWERSQQILFWSFPPLPPNWLTATPGSSHVVLSWDDASDNETGFNIQRSIDDGAWTDCGTQPVAATNAISYTDTPPTWHKIKYQISACNSSGTSVWVGSSTIMAPTKANSLFFDAGF